MDDTGDQRGNGQGGEAGKGQAWRRCRKCTGWHDPAGRCWRPCNECGQVHNLARNCPQPLTAPPEPPQLYNYSPFPPSAPYMQPQAAGFAQQYGMTYSPYPPPSTTSYTPYPAPMPSPYIPGPYQSPYTPLAQAGRGPVGSRSGSGVMSSTGRRERQGNNRGKGAAEGGLAPRSSGVQKAPRKEGNTIRRAQKPEPKREVGIALGVAPLARGSSSRARGHDASQGATVDAQAVSQDVDADGDVKMEDDDDAMGEEQDLDSDGDVRMRDA